MRSEKRYQVFVSSTYLDLRDERQAVTSALLQLNAIPSGMELFPAADDNAWTLIMRVIDDCDYYLLVIGGKYGSVDPVEEVSYTEKEYDYASSKGKPVMAFLHGDLDSIPAGKSERSKEAFEKLERFRAKVKGAKHIKYWTSAEDLAGKVALSFAQFTNQYPAVGWVRADQQASPEVLGELNGLRKRILELEGQLQVAETSPPPGTEHLAQGKEAFTLPVELVGTWIEAGRRKARVWSKAETDWDTLFGALAPRLLDECEEDALKQRLQDWLLDGFWSESWRELLRAKAEERGKPAGTALREIEANVSDDDFGTIIIQFVALGLITHSKKKRSVNDTGTYWTVTPFGRTRAIQLRARLSADS